MRAQNRKSDQKKGHLNSPPCAEHNDNINPSPARNQLGGKTDRKSACMNPTPLLRIVRQPTLREQVHRQTSHRSDPSPAVPRALQSGANPDIDVSKAGLASLVCVGSDSAGRSLLAQPRPTGGKSPHVKPIISPVSQVREPVTSALRWMRQWSCVVLVLKRRAGVSSKASVGDW